MLNSSKKVSIPKEIFEQIFMRNGGQKEDIQKQLTGQYITEIPENSPIEANAEIEKNEYVQTGGTVKKALGETHEKGGTEVALNEGDRVLSDHLKLSKDFAKKLSEEFEINAKPTDTYAKVLDKYLKKIGHTKATEELEEYIKKLDKQNETVKDETTLALNSDYLMKEINEEGEKLNELEVQKQQMFGLLFEAQEASKTKKEKEQETEEMQNGGTIQDLIIKYNIDENKIKSMFKNGGKLPKFQGDINSTFFSGLNPLNSFQTPNTNGQSNAQFYQQQATNRAVTDLSGSNRKYTPEEKKLIKKHYAKFVKDEGSLQQLEKSVDEDRLVFNEGMLDSIKRGDLIPIKLQHEGQGTFGKQTEDRINNYVYRNTFKQLTNEEFDPTNREHTKKIYDVVIPALKEKGITYHGAPFTNLNVDAYGNIVASEPGFQVQTEAKKAGSIDLDKFRIATPGQKQLLADEYGVTVDILEEQAKNPTNKFLKLTPKTQADMSAQGTVVPEVTEDVTTDIAVPTTDIEEQKRRAGLLMLPDQTPLMPPSMSTPLKFQPRVYGAERVEISDKALSEINRSQVSTQRMLEQMPDSVRASTLASMDANNAQNISKVVSETERYNAQARERENYEDARVKSQQSQLDAQSAAQYQQLMGQELNLYDQNLQNFYNRLQSNQMNNWKTIEMLNLNNALNPNIQYTGSGYEVINTPNFGVSPMSNLPTKEAPKKPKKQNGGEIRKKFRNRFGK